MTFTFDGFEPANTTPVPDILFDVLLSQLTGAELKVLLYIIRRTTGFKKTTDTISFTQFEKGIKKRDGEVLDSGTGLSRETISKALAGLEAKGCINSHKRTTASGDNDVTAYSIRFKGDVVGKPDYPTWSENPTRVVGKSDQGGTEIRPGVVGKSDPQLNSITRNSLQETVLQEGTFVATSAEDRNAPTSNIIPQNRLQERITDKHKAINLKGQADNGHLHSNLPGSGNGNTRVHDGLSEGVGQSKQVGRRDGKYDRGRQAEAESQLEQTTNESRVNGTTPVQRSGVSPDVPHVSSGAAQAGKSDTKEIQRRINEHRGYALEEKVDIVRERQAIKSWCNLHTIEEYGLVMAGAKKDKYWGKQENYYRIGGLTLLKITPEILARQRAPLPMVANGNGHTPPAHAEGLITNGDFVWWDNQWMTEDQANETGFNGGFGLYK